MSDQNWRTEVTAADYFAHQKKQVALADRRPVIRKPSDLVGPGIAATAVRVTDFNDILATYDGFFSADIGALNAPNNSEAFVGVVTGDAELGGRQSFAGLTSGDAYQRLFTRNPGDAATVYWGSWELVGSGTGGGGTFLETLPVSIINAKGDLIAGTGDNAATRVPVGADGYAVIANPAAAGGVSWAARLASVVAGDYIYIDDTDPLNPIINSYGGNLFWMDSVAVTVAGGPSTLTLSYMPRPWSLHFYWDGDEQIEGTDWTRTGLVITFVETHQKVGDRLEARYAYDFNNTGWSDIFITAPTAGSTITTPTPTFTGTATPGRPVEIFVDGVSIGTTTADGSGNWSFTPSTGLSTAAHSAVARQTFPDTTTQDSPAVAFTITVPLAAAYYPFDETSGYPTFLDASGNGRNGGHSSTTPAQPSLLTSGAGKSVVYSGGIGHSDVNYGSWMNGSVIAASCLFKTTVGGTLIGRDQASTGRLWDMRVGVSFGGGGPKLGFVFGGISFGTMILTPNTVNDGAKHMAAFSYDGATLKMYCDGALVLTQAVVAAYTGTSKLSIGGSPSGGGDSYLSMFDGTIDEVRYWAGSSAPSDAYFASLWAAS